MPANLPDDPATLPVKDPTASAPPAFPSPPSSTNSPAINSITRSRSGGGTVEIGGFEGLDPTRYGDWEHNGRCTDF